MPSLSNNDANQIFYSTNKTANKQRLKKYKNIFCFSSPVNIVAKAKLGMVCIDIHFPHRILTACMFLSVTNIMHNCTYEYETYCENNLSEVGRVNITGLPNPPCSCRKRDIGSQDEDINLIYIYSNSK